MCLHNHDAKIAPYLAGSQSLLVKKTLKIIYKLNPVQPKWACLLPLVTFSPEWLRRMNSPAVNYSLVWCLQKRTPRRCTLSLRSAAWHCSESCEMNVDTNQVSQTGPTWALWDGIPSAEPQMTTCVGIVCRMHAHIASLKMANICWILMMVGVKAMETSTEINVCYEGDYHVFTDKHTVILWSFQLDYMVPVCDIYCLLTHFLLIFKATLSIRVSSVPQCGK